jgi:hypothetical protein
LSTSFYDISIWEEIRSIVSWKTDRLVESINQEIPKDASLAEFQGKHPVPFQLREIMEQRANSWVQRLYDICCDAYKSRGKALSADFDRAAWFYRVQPFIMGENDSQIHSGTMGGFLNLLLCAVGSPPERRRFLTVDQKVCCFDVRLKVYEAWHDKLHHLPPRINEAIEAMASYNARQRRAARIVAELSPDDPPSPPATPVHPLTQPEESLPPKPSNPDPKTSPSNSALRVPDSLELEGDLAKVERCLRNLNTDATLSPQERTLRTLYYTHLREKFRLCIAGPKAAPKESGERLDTTSSASERLRNDNLHNVSALNHVGPFDESWEAITPPELIRPVRHIRKDFDDQLFWQHYYSEKQCFNDLHPLAAGLTEPAVFQRHFYAWVGELRKLVSKAFERLLAISRAQQGTIGAAAIEWATLQVTDLIERKKRLVDLWIKSACDGKNDARRGANTLEDRERRIFWTDWRAPAWLDMEPNRNVPYNASTAWERIDECETKSALKFFRENVWRLLLKATLEDQVGTAHEVLARQENSSTLQSQQPLPEPVLPVAEKNSLATPTSPVQVTSEQQPQISGATTVAPSSLAAVGGKLPKEQYAPLPPRVSDYSNLLDPAGLTELQRECFSLRHEYQLAVAEIARRLGRDRKTIQEHLDAANNKIKLAGNKERAGKRLARFGPPKA